MGTTVGWTDRFWRDGHRVKTTPTGLAASLAEGVVRGTNLLRTRLEEQGFARADVKRFESEACILECLLFEWFLRDVVVSIEFARRAGAIRRALAKRLSLDLDRSGLSPAALLDFDRLCRQRFAEYEEAMGTTSSLQDLGGLAWRHISSRDEPDERMTMLLAVRATAELRALRGLGQRYALLSIPRQFLLGER